MRVIPPPETQDPRVRQEHPPRPAPRGPDRLPRRLLHRGPFRRRPASSVLSALPRRIRHDPLVRAIAALDPDPLRVLLAVLLGVGALTCAIGLAATSAWLISRAAQHPPVLYLQLAVVGTRAFGIGRGVLRYVERLAAHDVALRGVVSVREHLYRSLASAEGSTVAALRRGDLLARVGTDVDTLADLVVRSLLPFAIALTTAAGSALLLLTLLPPAGVLVALCLLVAALVAPWLAIVSARRSHRAADETRDVSSSAVMSFLDDLPELTVAGGCPARLEHLRLLDEARFRRTDRAAAPEALAVALNSLAGGAAVVAALVTGIWAVRAGILDPVLLAVVTMTPLATAEAISGLPAAATGLVRCRAAAERILPLLDAPPAAASPPAPVAPPATPPRATTGALVACGLSCSWPGGPLVLRDFALSLGPGDHKAIVGASGSGKTTLLLTLAGLLPPYGGHVHMDGVPLPGFTPSTLRRTVNFTAEDAHIFHTTLGENLRVAADQGAPEADLVSALRRAGLGTWFARLPRGLDTVLGPDGTGISGGERRRLLLARAFLVQAPVLLLDEPAEHLDPDTADRLIRDILTPAPQPALPSVPSPDPRSAPATALPSTALPSATPPSLADVPSPGARPPTAHPPVPHPASTTGENSAPVRDTSPAVLIVTHRVTPLEAADEVIVLDRGKVAARGSHTWLSENHPPYRDQLLAERFVAYRTRATPPESAR